MKTFIKFTIKKLQGKKTEVSSQENSGIKESELRKIQQERDKYISIQNTRHFIL